LLRLEIQRGMDIGDHGSARDGPRLRKSGHELAKAVVVVVVAMSDEDRRQSRAGPLNHVAEGAHLGLGVLGVDQDRLGVTGDER
jgi:hypothetical protein